MPGSITIPPHLIQYIASTASSVDSAAEALEEWIQTRRSKGDTLFEVSVGLAELEDRTPPHCSIAFTRARYTANVPPPSDLTPPVGPFPLSRSASPVTILHHLLSQPPPSVEHSREVILEYVLSREVKLREKRHGRGGKGSLGREGFEEIAARLGEVEEGLRLPGVDSMQLSSNRQTELGHQLQKLSSPDAERVIVQHIRKRVGGEGRYAIGKELEHLEDMTARRPALRPAFRSAKARTTIPDQPLYQINLPAPSRSGCIKLITNFIKDIDNGGPSTPGVNSSSHGERSYFSPSRTESATSSPATPFTPLPNHQAASQDPNPIANFVFELVSEFITREKREYMLKCKWAIKGREALSKDLSEIEAAVCLGKGGASQHAAELVPAFLVLRRSYNLPKSTLPPSVIEPYLDILPAPPDPDDVPYREPSVANITARLYVNPRLDDIAAYSVLEELVDSEREIAEAAGLGDAEKIEWLSGLIDQIEKRFPDGSYEAVFARAKSLMTHPVVESQSARSYEAQQATLKPPKPNRQPSLHRRALSSSTNGDSQNNDDSRLPVPQSLERRLSHTRSASLPSRKATFDDTADIIELASDTSSDHAMPIAIAGEKPVLPPLSMSKSPSSNYLSPAAATKDRTSSGSAGWWDVVSAVDNDNRSSLPWAGPRTSSDHSILPLPPGAEPARAPEISSPLDEDFNKLDLDFSASPSTSPNYKPMTYGSPIRRGGVPQYNDGSPSSIRSENTPRVSQTAFRPPPVPINFERPSFPSPTPGSGPASASGTPDKSPPPVKSKLGTFGRSLSIASKSMLARSKEREKEKEKERERERDREEKEREVNREWEKENEQENESVAAAAVAPASVAKPMVAGVRRENGNKLMNNPGKWNKDMVANIMGPPVERR